MVCSLVKVVFVLTAVSLLWCPSMGGGDHWMVSSSPADVPLSSFAAAGAHKTPSLSRSSLHSAADAHRTPSLSRSAFVVTPPLALLSSLLLLLNNFSAAVSVSLQYSPRSGSRSLTESVSGCCSRTSRCSKCRGRCFGLKKPRHLLYVSCFFITR